ncbi:histidine phosphotransferase ChpT [Sulfitobacter noctilucicola]|uniref:Histidine phosphotransferase ChpT n=1 Tax=Sulfitobacter noctilucicola TaxID=1342301 RepID=A0A7W6Q5H2_9RHOB|nr:histidine phosphotransferase family protein [Sulfitobacter noctilucicola]KIN65049.1 histidine phosphotransferase ChpT [Sulfitobacter noctilucicola]MBB4173812.1 histidine phosphotransferase ChpT [Sulfitobacter noctilucicola]
MNDMDTTLASLIGSRICHDLISPIGAINNGLELLTMSGEQTGPEMGLINKSVGNASAKIRFFRVAFGAAGEQMIGPAEVNSILRDLYGDSRLAIKWAPEHPVQRIEVRLAFLALLCAENAMPYGGRLNVSTDGASWTLDGSADRLNVDPALWCRLSDQSAPQGLQPSNVQFALLPLIAGDTGRKITFKSDEATLKISY